MTSEDHDVPPPSPDDEGSDAAQDGPGRQQKPKRKKAFRFLPSSDVFLLKEVAVHTPWAAAHGETNMTWTNVANADSKACRRRFTVLLDTFRREEMESLRASGTAEEYREREQLLMGCLELVMYRRKQKEKKEAARREAASNQVVRDAMIGMRTKTPKRTSTEAIIEYLESKDEGQPSRDKQRQRHIDLQERRLALDEQSLQQDREKTNSLVAMMAAQMGILAKLAEKLSKQKSNTFDFDIYGCSLCKYCSILGDASLKSLEV
ncbi:hypothetical protein JG688_00009085 [Phytophthora aleatoria]|uniref:Myb-like domain-containing protein n=1 Tax=Phytophthora aleatoria TaxID=2496075 RepID=A0A8J5MG14_9STRA|nr:hypothetical protein JG688_00009085 [Phytophthora aleatoria]